MTNSSRREQLSGLEEDLCGIISSPTEAKRKLVRKQLASALQIPFTIEDVYEKFYDHKALPEIRKLKDFGQRYGIISELILAHSMDNVYNSFMKVGQGYTNIITSDMDLPLVSNAGYLMRPSDLDYSILFQRSDRPRSVQEIDGLMVCSGLPIIFEAKFGHGKEMGKKERKKRKIAMEIFGVDPFSVNFYIRNKKRIEIVGNKITYRLDMDKDVIWFDEQISSRF